MSRVGEICTKSGTYSVVHDTAHRYPHSIPMAEGQSFMPCGKAGCSVTYTLIASDEEPDRTSKAVGQPVAIAERPLFRFTGTGEKQYACTRSGAAWAIQSQDEFFEANGGASSRLWVALPYVPKPMEDFPELEAALAKVREYVELERPVREKMASHRKQGVLADEAELLGKVAHTYGRIISMHLANAVRLFEARRYPFKFLSMGGC